MSPPASATEIDATGLAAEIKSGSTSASDAVVDAIHQIEEANPRVNAVVQTRFDEALREVDTGLPTGPLHGVPLLVKDLGIEVEGLPYSAGSGFFNGAVGQRDSLITRRLRAAGAVILGATNTPELGRLMTTEPLLHGPTRNPWNPSYSAGGSSGSSAAAVAAGMVPIAHASDAGGSIRLPASACGTFGFKPTRGRVPTDAPTALSSLLSVQHGITRTVRDSAMLLDILGRPLPGDVIPLEFPAGGYLTPLERKPPRLRIAVTHATPSGVAVSGDARRAVDQAARLCEELGHHVIEAKPEYELAHAFAIAKVVFGVNLVSTLDKRSAELGRDVQETDLEPFTWQQFLASKKITATEYQDAMDSLQMLSWQLGQFFDGYDVLVTPTLGRDIPPIGHLAGTEIDHIIAEASEFWQFTGVYNVTGHPAMSIPLRIGASGLPVGVHIASKTGADDLLLRLAAQLEDARPWPLTAPGYPVD